MNENNEYFNFSEILYKLNEGNVICRTNIPPLKLIWKEGNHIMCHYNGRTHSYIFNNRDIFAENWKCFGPIKDIKSYLKKVEIEQVENFY